MHTKRHLLAIVMAAATAMAAKAQDTLEVRQMSLAGPYAVETPIASDTVGTDGKRHDVESTLLGSLPLDAKATTTYSGGIFPPMDSFLHHLLDHAFQKRTIAFVENGTWMPAATKGMKALTDQFPGVEYAEHGVTVKGALNDDSRAQIDALAEELAAKF